MAFPLSWKLKNENDVSPPGSKQRRLVELEFIDVFYRQAGSPHEILLDDSVIMLTGLEGTKMEIKINFDSPELLSLSDQNEQDEIFVRFAPDFVLNDEDGNSLTLDFGETIEDGIIIRIPI